MTLMEHTAGDLMTKDLVTVDPDETLRAAAAMMSRGHLHCLIVLPADPRRALGVITMKDIVQVLCEGDETMVDRLRVRDVMSDPAICVQRDAILLDCVRLMRTWGIRAAPVLAGTTPVGLLSFSDVLRHLSAAAAG